MSDYKSNGVDFDDLFDPDVQGDGPTAPTFKNRGTPLRYADIKYGSKRADVGYADAAGDLSNKWAAKGTAVYAHVIADPGYPPVGSTYNIQGEPGTVHATAIITLKSDGTWRFLGSTSGSPGVPRTGDWFDPAAAGVGADYQVRFVFTATQDDGASITNDASSWISLSVDRDWSATVSGPGNSGSDKWLQGTLQIQIRRASDSVVLSNVSCPVTVGLQKM